MLMNQELLAKYDYLDELDYRGLAWEILRRHDDYRADFDRLQTLERPEPFNSEHESLAQKWHVRCMLSPDSREVPEFFHERYQNIPIDLMWRNPREWQALMKEKQPPRFMPEALKHSLICRDLKRQKCTLNQIAERLYPGHKGESQITRHHPARDRVRDDLKRLKKIETSYIKIALRYD